MNTCSTITLSNSNSRNASSILITGILNQKLSIPSKFITCVNSAGKIIKIMAGPSIEPASLTLCDLMASANSSATTITANSIIDITISKIASSDKSGTPIKSDDASYPIANNKPKICNNTPTLVIVATPNHLPINNSLRVHGSPNNASSVPLSLSPAVISIDG